MKIVEEAILPYNTGKSFSVKRGQRIRVNAESTVDFVPLNLDDLRERFN